MHGFHCLIGESHWNSWDLGRVCPDKRHHTARTEGGVVARLAWMVSCCSLLVVSGESGNIISDNPYASRVFTET